MPHFDLIVRNGLVVSSTGERRADLGVIDGMFAAIEPELGGTARDVIDVEGAVVYPGAVDPHVHFNEPGRTDWEGWASGSAALAAGGGTTCLEMPLNATPPTLDRASFTAKAEAASAKSHVDFGLWGGLTPTNLDHLEDLAGCGVIGFKAFMSASGTVDFQHADDDTLFRGMALAARLGLPVAVHAENDAITSGMAASLRRSGHTSARDYLASRPVVAELEAIGRAITLAEAAGCALHVVHVSTGRGVAMIAEARGRGIDVTCETCPHYLLFTGEDVERIGALAKCAPPLRDRQTQEELWSALEMGDVDWIASDHSPAPSSMKTGDDFFAIWGGISGCQHLIEATIPACLERGIPPQQIARLIATNAAGRFRLDGKGDIAVGKDADFTWGHAAEPRSLNRQHVHYRHPASLWDHHPLGWRVRGTVLRGTLVALDSRIVAPPSGRLLRPDGPVS
ncbi:MAG TPA: allantoinase AllB [Thermomicrobiales bacterium]|nr:allantoinase AllB [Thermomicrobiales bacterium]